MKAIPLVNTPEWVTEFHQRDLTKWAAVVKASGARTG